MKITERRLRSIIRSVIRENIDDEIVDYPEPVPPRERNALVNPSDSEVHPMHVGNRREAPDVRAVRIAKAHCPDCTYDNQVEKLEDEDSYVVYFNHQDVHVIVPGEFSDRAVEVHRGMS